MSTLSLIIIAAIVLLIVVIAIIALRRHQTKAPHASSESESIKNNQVYVGNLAYSVGENDLRKFFQGFGEIAMVRIVRNNKTGRSKGFAFVTYKDISQVDKALEANGKQLHNRKLVVRIAKARL